MTYPIPETSPTPIEELELNKDELFVVQDLLDDMIQEALYHPDVFRVIDEAKLEPPPLFAQFVPTSAHRIAKEPPINQRAERNFYKSPEIKELFENVLEETIYNLMREARFGDFDLLSIPPMVSKTIGFSQVELDKLTNVEKKRVKFL